MEYDVFEVVFTKSKKKFAIGSKAIMLWTGKNYSHVAIGLEVRDWGVTYFQASEGDVNYNFNTFFNKKHEIVKSYKLKLPKTLVTDLRKSFYQNQGEGYAFFQNLGIACLDVLEKITGKIFKNPFTRGKNCSELAFVKVFKPLLGDKVSEYDENTIKPHHIEDIITLYCTEYIVEN